MSLKQQEDLFGQQLGNYHLLRVLGQGTFAVVYLGEHRYLERLAAIKVLQMRIEPARQEAFRREARTIAQLTHPHIVAVHDFDIQDQVPYLVMEYMPYGTLRQRYPKGTRLPFEQIMVYVKQIASALDYAHQRRVIHRDIKPENILLNTNQELVLSDFGIAVVQHTLGTLSAQNPAGTPIYMAPEQIRHRPCTASDQYALGVMVYEWLCGEPPFLGSLYEIFGQHLHKTPPSLCARLPELPSAAEDTVFGALSKDPQQRFSTLQDFATALEAAFWATQPLSLSGLGTSPVDKGRQDLSALSTAPTLLTSRGREDSRRTPTIPMDKGSPNLSALSAAPTLLTFQGKEESRGTPAIARTNRQAPRRYRRPWLRISALSIVSLALCVSLLFVFLPKPSWCPTTLCPPSQSTVNLQGIHDSNLQVTLHTIQSSSYAFSGNPGQYTLDNLPRDRSALRIDTPMQKPYRVVLGVTSLQQGHFGLIIEQVVLVVKQVTLVPLPLRVWTQGESQDYIGNIYQVSYDKQDAGANLLASYRPSNGNIDGMAQLIPGESDELDVQVTSQVVADLQFQVEVKYRVINESREQTLLLPNTFEVIFSDASNWSPYHMENGHLLIQE